LAEAAIRRAREDDLASCLAMFRELDDLQRPWRVFAPRVRIEEEMARSYRAALDDADSILVVADDQGEVVGMAAGHVHRPSTFSEQRAVELSSVFVRPSHRRQGIGRALTAEVARFAREAGAERVTLRTFAQNEAAVEAWRRMGFEPRALQMTAPSERLLG
jgi:ribosomal protein S18 acetylase RimI-like enzyme